MQYCLQFLIVLSSLGLVHGCRCRRVPYTANYISYTGGSTEIPIFKCEIIPRNIFQSLDGTQDATTLPCCCQSYWRFRVSRYCNLIFVEPACGYARHSCYTFSWVYVRASVRICPDHNLYNNAWISKLWHSCCT